jgi:hypothetical protein
MNEELLKSRILEAIRRFNGELDWAGLAIAVGIDPYTADASLPLLAAAITSLHRANAFRMEFDEYGIVRFWVDESGE